MYLRSAFEETRVDVLHAHVRAHPLGTFVTVVDGDITIDHFPFLISAEGGELGSLHGHIPRANAVWQSLDGEARAVVVFQGADSYITPSWYPSKLEHGRVVPTWNYAVVQASGRPRAIDDSEWLLAHLNALTDRHEAERAEAWKVADAPADFIERMVTQLVGIEMPIDSLVGKWKLSQNRPETDRRGVAAGLRERGDDAAIEMAQLVEAALDPTGFRARPSKRRTR